ncbi:TlpA family protein disulfide reductase (plasmid) [Rhizobium leguminosarum]|nr:TlpA family protein disulfide reductase [Rhizobium leguminosarum]
MKAHFLIGSLAPSIETLTWIRGNPIFALERGKIHIVALFATTCGFCSKSHADLGQLQEKYRDIGLEALGVAARERVATADEARARVDTWLNKELPDPTIPIAFEHTGEMNKLWWVAGGSFADPTIFVVDRDNSIAHIGYPDPEDPDLLERVLIKVMDGSWDTSAEAKNAQEKWLEGVLLFRAIAAVNIKDFQTALSTIEEGIKAIPDNLPFREAHVELLLGRMHDFEAGWIVLARLARNAIEKMMVSGFWRRCSNSSVHRTTTPAFRLRNAFDGQGALGEHSDTVSATRWHLTRAFLRDNCPFTSMSGDKDRAVESIAHALELVEGESLPDDVKQEYLAQLEAALAEYKG